MARRDSSRAEQPPVTAEWRELLCLLPSYDPFRAPGDAWFDAPAAEHAISFIEECIVHVEGAMAGQPFLLQPWQRSFVANLFGWKRRDGLGRVVRRYREVLLYVPRKNGKTALAAAIALYVFFCDGEKGQQSYIAAAEREQAGMLFRQCKGMVEAEPMMKKGCRVYGGNAAAGQSRSLYRESDHSFLRVISADADSQHGGTSHLVIIDELHAQPSRDLVDVLTTSTASLNRAQPLTIYLTTADHDRPSICNEVHDRACKVCDGVIDDPSFLPAVFEAGREDDWRDPAVWRKANPNLGVSVSEEYLVAECKKAEGNPAKQAVLKRLHLNIKTGAASAAIDLARWDACATLTDPSCLDGRECFGGLDLSTTTDLTAYVLLFREEEDTPAAWSFLPFFWAPRNRAREREKTDRVPYLAWAEQGLLKLTEGDVVDYDVVREDVLELSQRYRLAEVGADRWNATQLLTQLQGASLKVVAFGQGYASMTAPTKELLALITSGRISHTGHPIMRWMASNLMTETDAAANLKPSKAKSSDRIDGFVALIMALGRAMLQPVQGGGGCEFW